MVYRNSIPDILGLCHQPAASCRCESRGNQRRDPGETQPTLEELGDRDLVRCVEHGRRTTACFERTAGQCKCGKTLKVRCLEVELRDLGEIEPRRGPVD